MKQWMINAATILFDDTKNDLRALPKTVRLQLLTVLSFVWSTAFTLYIWGVLHITNATISIILLYINQTILIILYRCKNRKGNLM